MITDMIMIMIMIIIVINIKNNSIDSHSHGHSHSHSGPLQDYINMTFNYVEKYTEGYSKEKQAYMGAILISSASIPIFIIILIFNITNVGLLDSMSSFAAGALIGDVFLHNLPEIYGDENNETNFFLKKETLIGMGIIFMFAFEKLLKLLMKKGSKVAGNIKNLNVFRYQ